MWTWYHFKTEITFFIIIIFLSATPKDFLPTKNSELSEWERQGASPLGLQVNIIATFFRRIGNLQGYLTIIQGGQQVQDPAFRNVFFFLAFKHCICLSVSIRNVHPICRQLSFSMARKGSQRNYNRYKELLRQHLNKKGPILIIMYSTC